MAFHDYEEFIAALNAHEVRYLVIGAHAVAFHARPRATKDLDILLEPTPANGRRALAALRDFFGGVDLGYTVEDLASPEWIIQLGIAPVRIDLQAGISGFASFEEAWEDRVDALFGTVPTHYLGLDNLIRAKEAAGRPQDRADVRVLRRTRSQTRPVKRSSPPAKRRS